MLAEFFSDSGQNSDKIYSEINSQKTCSISVYFQVPLHKMNVHVDRINLAIGAKL